MPWAPNLSQFLCAYSSITWHYIKINKNLLNWCSRPGSHTETTLCHIFFYPDATRSQYSAVIPYKSQAQRRSWALWLLNPTNSQSKPKGFQCLILFTSPTYSGFKGEETGWMSWSSSWLTKLLQSCIGYHHLLQTKMPITGIILQPTATLLP